ncbi:hypothetical protein A2950_01315 [Candidatus Kaiserbacteria bacterium RIFCSPLOWO2_01_FULL_55_19]|uniref:Helix-turn-helix domain-containing protein n=1 Tax=Candidatus Kaiserbacteria bacterium RIFCSPLOWO2_01_FULL_55_19 TaxID=1798516 RepID=A0A1F6ERU1_9BACT|nr:MAG: hypothetical protein A2950_01315 [Candidatus Kaiserbacteria bacterium RIFCSPLOWO2_01_FULL_55_19]
MDEILIEEKRYVSSKQAAKVTGYAKDYIGQLCREGRVPARLVGRSWYVLESAIHDHRFGNPEPKNGETAPSKQRPTSGWETPRYESSNAAVLPSVNRLREITPPAVSESESAQQPLQDSWKAWFDRVTDTEPRATPIIVTEISPESDERAEEARVTEESVSIPIHTVYELPPEDLLPHRAPPAEDQAQLEAPKQQEIQIHRGGRGVGRGIIRTIRLAGALVALVVVTLAALGTGYFDTYILSNSQASLMAGVSLYNR